MTRTRKWSLCAAGVLLLAWAPEAAGQLPVSRFTPVVDAQPCATPARPPEVIVTRQARRAQVAPDLVPPAPGGAEAAVPPLPPLPAPPAPLSDVLPKVPAAAGAGKAAAPLPSVEAPEVGLPEIPVLPVTPGGNAFKPEPGKVKPATPAVPPARNLPEPTGLPPVPPSGLQNVPFVLPANPPALENAGDELRPVGNEELPPRPKPNTVPKESVKAAVPVAKPKDVSVNIPAARVPGRNSSPWVVRVEIVDAKTHLFAQGRDTEFHIVCESLKMQSPSGDIQAEGDITMLAAGLEMQCSRLVISWQEDWVRMEGGVRVAANQNGQKVELKGDQLGLKLTTLGSKEAFNAARMHIRTAGFRGAEAVQPTAAEEPRLRIQLPRFYQRVLE